VEYHAVSDKPVVPEGSDGEAPVAPVASEDIEGLLRQVLAGMGKMSASFDGLSSDVTSIRSDLSAMKTDITTMRGDITSMKREVNALQREVKNLSDGAERQDKRLAAIESLPTLPMSQPPRYYATEAHSVSIPKRVRLSHIG
jgi:outer membrane murein-binding lipoprotein Lpp